MAKLAWSNQDMRLYILVAIQLLFMGCASKVPVDLNRAELMPQSVAIKIIAKYTSADWANSPYLEKTGSCGPDKNNLRINFKDIKNLTYNPTLGKLFVMPEHLYVSSSPFSGCLQMIGFSMDETAAIEVSSALRSLGACAPPNAKC